MSHSPRCLLIIFVSCVVTDDSTGVNLCPLVGLCYTPLQCPMLTGHNPRLRKDVLFLVLLGSRTRPYFHQMTALRPSWGA
ncbi:uncharacterized protein EDB91DRAFT_1155331 [Suillus paluster]|uniref:uncharacterized protein n=1 Tax=Suillus paluster TaxID=48578 RepID=UPI001B86ED38|nr:uncharacterized protein EDB91DRAFT_1155331 [Suillus paluster]KAG1731067.1 hypothetical protein EDB91DRAFT_1155331 [Suillus paluster]